MMTQHQRIENLTLNTMSMVRLLQVSGEDMSAGFIIDQQCLLDVLDQIADNLIELEQLNRGYGYEG